MPDQPVPGRCTAPTSAPDVSICIVSFNTRDLLRVCLRSAVDGTRCATEVIVVDNASNDASADMVAREFPRVCLVRSASNLGFAAAANVAMREARSRTVLLLNPDTTVPDGAIDRLLTFLDEHSVVGACGPALVYPDGRFQCCGYRFPSFASEWRDATGDWWRRGPFRRWRGRRPVEPGPVEWVSGACVLVRRDVLTRVGLFDEQFYLYGEELDWFVRAGRAGIATWIVPSVEVVHHLGQSAATVGAWASAHLLRTRLQYYWTHRGTAHAGAVWILYVARATGRWLLGRPGARVELHAVATWPRRVQRRTA